MQSNILSENYLSLNINLQKNIKLKKRIENNMFYSSATFILSVLVIIVFVFEQQYILPEHKYVFIVIIIFPFFGIYINFIIHLRYQYAIIVNKIKIIQNYDSFDDVLDELDENV